MSEAPILKMHDSLFERIRSGEKATTIRMGRKDISLGLLVLQGTGRKECAVAVDVRSVSYMVLKDVPKHVLDSEGCGTIGELFKLLRIHYYNLTERDEVTVVRFDLA